MTLDQTIPASKLRFVEPHQEDIDLSKKGDQEAMCRLYHAYGKAMLNTSFRILNNRQDAEDVLQDSMIKAFSKLDQFSGQSTFGAWLKRIVVNKSIDFLRGRSTGVKFDETPAEEIPDCPFEMAENVDLQPQLDQVYKALHQMPDGYRTVLSLYLLEGYDHEEISGILNIGISTSISQLSRAKKKLKLLILNSQNDG